MSLFDENDHDRNVVLEEFNRKKKTASFRLKTKPHQNALADYTFSLTFKEMFDLRRKFNLLLKDVEEEKKDNRSAMQKLWKKKQHVDILNPNIIPCAICGNKFDIRLNSICPVCF